ncbi:hypothetical protein BATDEDRAFT_85225 [Batrachochytrium dendrobatidis JAM81]|uniref:Uncharacterized protein n=1 Tax=Batrachochytrium dendrobatidis (strain JAM81 / FGSC 10211) TaxID=684364 RepID=F4NV40_BATDJ|nr:uncharacterized protein BATDEDRAFT_85225 [Batrachochytrium dendrobatidis JAM81]EGF84469.1 hypothetical protein BATDEDRAFT_85225 [Batrachochytrium dendrobatidis JAM81]KAJ8327458.1 hypothetical protein O5D80_004844 [Batrachochytrium dendrobatidis]KAK5665154.1 hypothetical protein QVD99_008002 [Batrachochytrium dendrobatidis]|eukprot:XP_006676454.1 hypothetical protein BATDEDRAFT_85225 [Batrachochytrium dendrobatidis JAM81]
MLLNSFVTVAPWIRTLRPALHPKRIANYSTSIATWGAFAGIAALFFIEPTSLARRDIFTNIPVVGGFWQKKLDAMELKD